MSRGRQLTPAQKAAIQRNKERAQALRVMKFLGTPSSTAAALGVTQTCMDSLCADGLVKQAPGMGPFPVYTITDAGRRA